jgi:Fe2+ transport system protein FeoA
VPESNGDACPSCPSPGEAAPAKTGRSVLLTELRPGEHGVVERHTLASDDAALLSAMGLCCNARVRLCRVGQPCIVAVISGRGGECRIGLARSLAERLHVEITVDDRRGP